MPNRILRDWTDSFTMDDLDVHAERFFVRLIMKVDDFGRFSADKRLLKSQLFPLKSDIRDTDIARFLTACEKAGLITIYTVASKCYLQIENFKQTLRQKTTKYPSPDECIANDMQVLSNSVSIASLKRNETETRNEEETETENTPIIPKGEEREKTNIDNKTSNNQQYEELSKKVATKKVFIPPTAENVQEYCDERKNGINGDEFVNFYQSKGWMVGKNKMKDWQAAIRTWEQSRKNNGKSNNQNSNNGFSYQNGNTATCFKASGKKSASSILAERARREAARNCNGGDFTTEAEVVIT